MSFLMKSLSDKEADRARKKIYYVLVKDYLSLIVLYIYDIVCSVNQLKHLRHGDKDVCMYLNVWSYTPSLRSSCDK